VNRKGIIFSLTAVFLFTSLIIAGTNVNTRINNERKSLLQETPARVDRAVYNTISNDIAVLFKTSADTTGNITINEQMPVNISERVNDYESFIQSTYLTMMTSNVSIIAKEEALYLSNHSKITYGENKSWFNLTSNESINYYTLTTTSSSNTNSKADNWVWTGSGVYVDLTIQNQNGSSELINGASSGYVNPSTTNSFNITYNDGSILSVELSNHLLVNTSGTINTSLTIDLTGEVYTGHELSINSSVLEMIKEYRTIIR